MQTKNMQFTEAQLSFKPKYDGSISDIKMCEKIGIGYDLQTGVYFIENEKKLKNWGKEKKQEEEFKLIDALWLLIADENNKMAMCQKIAKWILKNR